MWGAPCIEHRGGEVGFCAAGSGEASPRRRFFVAKGGCVSRHLDPVRSSRWRDGWDAPRIGGGGSDGCSRGDHVSRPTKAAGALRRGEGRLEYFFARGISCEVLREALRSLGVEACSTARPTERCRGASKGKEKTTGSTPSIAGGRRLRDSSNGPRRIRSPGILLLLLFLVSPCNQRFQTLGDVDGLGLSISIPKGGCVGFCNGIAGGLSRQLPELLREARPARRKGTGGEKFQPSYAGASPPRRTAVASHVH